jgi:opacity protein-like surface antigen
MRKITTIIVIALLLSTSLMAQKKKWGHFGLKTGLNYSSISTDDDVDNKWNTGFVLGAFVKIPLHKGWAIQPEFLYSAMGGGIETGIPPANDYRLNYFTIPVLIKYQFCKGLNAVAGPQIDFLIQGKRRNSGLSTKITDDLNEFGFNATGGLEWWPTRCLSFGLRYIHGFNNILDDDDNTPNPNNWKNRGVQLTVGVSLN